MKTLRIMRVGGAKRQLLRQQLTAESAPIANKTFLLFVAGSALWDVRRLPRHSSHSLLNSY